MSGRGEISISCRLLIGRLGVRINQRTIEYDGVSVHGVVVRLTLTAARSPDTTLRPFACRLLRAPSPDVLAASVKQPNVNRNPEPPQLARGFFFSLGHPRFPSKPPICKLDH